MTGKNADVEWLRQDIVRADEIGSWSTIPPGLARRLLAHIDELGAEVNAWKAECVGDRLKAMADRRPTIHEIAADLYARWVATHEMTVNDFQACAKCCYDAAEALVAEGRRRDGL